MWCWLLLLSSLFVSWSGLGLPRCRSREISNRNSNSTPAKFQACLINRASNTRLTNYFTGAATNALALLLLLLVLLVVVVGAGLLLAGAGSSVLVSGLAVLLVVVVGAGLLLAGAGSSVLCSWR